MKAVELPLRAPKWVPSAAYSGDQEGKGRSVAPSQDAVRVLCTRQSPPPSGNQPPISTDAFALNQVTQSPPTATDTISWPSPRHRNLDYLCCRATREIVLLLRYEVDKNIPAAFCLDKTTDLSTIPRCERPL